MKVAYVCALVLGGMLLWGAHSEAQDKPDTRAKPGAAQSGDTKKQDGTKAEGASGQKTDTAKATPPTAADLNSRARALIGQQKYEDAIVLLKQAIALEKNNIESHVELALAYNGAKRFNEAAKEFRAAVELNPQRASFHDGLGGTLMELGKYAEARTEFERAQELEPSEITYRIEIGDTYMQEKDYLAAYSAYLKALGYAPDNPRVHLLLADADEQLSRHADALEEYETALRLDHNNLGAMLGRATALTGLKRYAEAEKIMRDLVAKSPKEASVHSGLAQVLDSAGKHTEAIAEYNAALAITADDPILWGNLGWAQYNAGLMDDSVKSSRKALELDSKLTYVRLNLGLVYAVRDRWNEAQKEYAQAVAGAAASDIHSGINDVRDAMAKGKPNNALKKALDYLTASEWKAMGLPEATQPGTAPRPSKTLGSCSL